jgi:Arc/MetJ family transcription regulator
MPDIAASGYIDCVRRTTLDIDEDMLSKAREILGTRGVKDTVDEALREVVRREAGKRLIAWLKENEDLSNPEIMDRAWPSPPIIS